MVAVPLAATAFYGSTSNFPWDNPGAAAGQARARAERRLDGRGASRSSRQRLAQEPGRRRGLAHARPHLPRVRPATTSRWPPTRRPARSPAARTHRLQLDLAEALVLTEKPGGQGKAKQIIDAALAADATNQKALWYSGVMAVRGRRHGDREDATSRSCSSRIRPTQIREILRCAARRTRRARRRRRRASGRRRAWGMGGMGGMGARRQRPSRHGRTIRIAVSVDPALAGKAQARHARVRQRARARHPGPAALQRCASAATSCRPRSC